MTDVALELEWLPDQLALVRLDPAAPLPSWLDDALRANRFVTVSRSDREISIIAPRGAIPSMQPCVGPYSAARLRGVIPLETVGVFVRLAAPLAQAEIPIFVISTFETDYMLIRTEQRDAAIQAWRADGIAVDDAG